MKKLIIHSKKYGNKTVLYDDEDHYIISKFTWHVNRHGKNFYVKSCYPIKKGIRHDISLHRLILGYKKPYPFIDHVNRNALDNRKSNLRITTQSTNQFNTTKNIRNTSGYKGVSSYTIGPNKGKFVPNLKVNGKKIHGGYFKSARKAAKKYNELALKYHGEFAVLNKL